MNQDVKACVEARTNFFETYVTVPDAVRPEVDAFVKDITALGERSADAASFEQAFAAEGLSDRFNSLVPRCSQKPVEMTAEQKQQSKDIYLEMRGGAKGILKDVGMEAIDDVEVAVEEEMLAQSRKAMIKDGTFDEYTKVTNAVEDAGRVGGFFKGLFGKKK